MGDSGRTDWTSPAERGERGDSDAELLRRLRGGTGDAATLLYFRYADHLHSVAASKIPRDLAARLDAEDIVQSVFRTFFRRVAIGQFEVPDGEDLWKLFLVIALNKIRSAGTYHRAACRDIGRTPQMAAECVSVDPKDGRDENALSVLQLVIDEILSDLPETTRPIIERRIDGFEVAEIAEIVGRSKRSVERILRDFRERLDAAIAEGI